MIKIKDTVAKIAGILAVQMFIMDGALKTGTSVWAGPIGGTVRKVCFAGDTELELDNGKTKCIKDVLPGEILHNGSKIIGALKLLGETDNPLYKIFSKNLNKDIRVTGSHLIQDPSSEQFIPVEKYNKAECTNNHEEFYYNLITDDHLIIIGEHTFYDWDD